MDVLYTVSAATSVSAEVLAREAAALSGVQESALDDRFLLLRGNGDGGDWAETLAARMRKSGMHVELTPVPAAEAIPGQALAARYRRRSLIWLLSLILDALGIAAFVAALLCARFLPTGMITPLLPTIACGILTLPVLVRFAGSVATGGRLSEEPCALLAALWLFLIGGITDAAWVLALYGLARELLGLAAHRSERRKRRLLECVPERGILCVGDCNAEMPAERIPEGARVRVPRTGRIPVDGTIESGRGRLETGTLTGEGEPRWVRPGDAVYAGFVNMDEEMVIRAARPGGTESAIMSLIDAPQDPCAQTRTTVLLSRALTAVGVIVAAALALPALLSGQVGDTRVILPLLAAGWGRMGYSAFLLHQVTLEAAAARGVRATGRAFAALARAKQFLFEKTAVLTLRSYEVASVMYVQGYSREDVLGTAAIAEANSAHPIAQAIRRANQGTPSTQYIENWQAYAGEGVGCAYAGHRLLVGNELLMRRGKVPCDSMGTGTPIYVAVDGDVIGVIMMTNPLREDAAAAMAGLKRLGAARTQLVTGDRREIAQELYAEAGMDGYQAGLRDEGRARALAERRGLGPTACVADGLGGSVFLDGPADMAMDGACDRAAMEILSGNLIRVADALRLARDLVAGTRLCWVFGILAKAISYAVLFLPDAYVFVWLPAALDAVFAAGMCACALLVVRQGRADVVKFPHRVPPTSAGVMAAVPANAEGQEGETELPVPARMAGDIPAMPAKLQSLSPEARAALLREEHEREEAKRREEAEIAEMEKQMQWRPPED